MACRVSLVSHWPICFRLQSRVECVFTGVTPLGSQDVGPWGKEVSLVVMDCIFTFSPFYCSLDLNGTLLHDTQPSHLSDIKPTSDASSRNRPSSVSLDLTELRNKVAKIKVNPRGNLWATGHFMGKKSVVDSERLPTEDDSTMKAIEAALNPQQVEPADLYQEMLRIALQTHLDSQEIRPKVPETAILMKILDSYIQDNKK
ncbi:hypothetical protein QQF64_030444 [Cirrhinus molitorella]|uniref:Neuromedin B n=1 Tax=Cirrhinus molitorella TaxID=172907 RepID=A0ABR3N3C4_9TELE